MNKKYTIINNEKCSLGEGPIWDEINYCLHYVDIDGKKVHTIDWKTKVRTTKFLSQKVGSIFMDKNSKLFGACEDGVYDLETMSLIHEKKEILGDRFNDGKVGPDGRIYVGTMDANGNAALYRVANGKIDILLNDVHTSNGLDWSLDNKTFYYCDTPTRKIDAFDFDIETGNISNRRTLIEIPESYGYPDGFTMDCDDNIYLALWDGAAMIKIDTKKKEIVDKVQFPTKKITCPVFVGSYLDELVITSANKTPRNKVDEYAGQTFYLKVNAKGKFSNRFNG